MSNYDVVQRKKLIFDILLEVKSLKGRRILEVGSGTGHFSEEIEKRGGLLTILDIGHSLVKSVSSTIKCAGVVGNAVMLPFSDESFDVIISSECIEHTIRPDLAVLEMCRVCKVDGYVCLTTPNRLWYPVLLFAHYTGLRKYSGIENWNFPHRIVRLFKQGDMDQINLSGCHLLPFQTKSIQPLLRLIDRHGKQLYRLMINFGIMGQKGQNKISNI